MFKHINVMDFKVMNVDGQDKLSMLYAVEGNAYILDEAYAVQEKVFTGVTGVTFNMHDFHTIEDGRKYLYLQRNITEASEEMSMQELGFNGKCKVTFPGIEERDVKSKNILWKWDGTGNIPFSDSTMNFAPAEVRCSSHWDYLHSNAIDKFADGNYLFSARHSDTIYKISADDGSILWRLHGHGGERSDFDMGNLNFSRQHHARIHEQNETHTIITFLDNAVGADQQPATSQWSRALTVSLREDLEPMTAEIIASYDHPKQRHSFRRGSYQVLPDGNVFVGWSERGLMSEHTADGEIVMQAELEPAKLGSYRAFKFPWTSKPDYPPDVHSETFSTSNSTSTVVHVSWNGATEVATWNLFKTDAAGKRALEVSSVPRSGFETRFEHMGYAKYVFVQAIDRHGGVLGKSDVIETLTDTDLSSDILAQENAWLQGEDDSTEPSSNGSSNGILSIITGNSFATFGGGIIFGVLVFLVVVFTRRRGIPWPRSQKKNKGPNYQRVAAADAWEFDESRLDDLSSNGRRRRGLDDGEFQLAEDSDEDDDSDERGKHNRTPSTGDSSGGG